VEVAANPAMRPGLRARDRAVAAFLLVLLVVGSLVLWIGVPVATLWALAQATDSATHHFVLGLIAVPLAMAMFAPLLFWVNALYLRVTGAYRVTEDEEGPRQRLRGPLEPIFLVCFIVALVALIAFFAVSDIPQRQVI
jgi:hypothetical protein